MKWEYDYDVLRFKGADKKEEKEQAIRKWLNEKGKEGWELVKIVAHTYSIVTIFKRPVKEK